MQDYKLIIRTLTTGATQVTNGQLASQNASEFMAYLNEVYLSQGYTLQSVQALRTDATGSTTTYEFAYHLVKEVSTKSK